MLEGLMQNDYQLTLKHVLDRMRGPCADGQVVTLTDAGTTRASYGEVAERVDALARATRVAGRQAGRPRRDVHVELAAAPRAVHGGAVHGRRAAHAQHPPVRGAAHLHRQPRQGQGHLRRRLAGSAAREGGADVRGRRAVRRGRRRGRGRAPERDPLRGPDRAERRAYDYPDLDERTAAGLCYTSGTTGNPKGVLYSHRSNVLHCLASGLADTIGVTASDRVLPVVPMFHVNAWGFPYACAMVGADLVMPGRFLQPEPLAKLIESERVTIAGAVPDDLDGPAAVGRRAQAGPLQPAERRLRRRGGARVADARVRGAPRRPDHAGVGHDRDQPDRRRRAPAGGRRGRGALALPHRDRPDRAARRRAPDGRRRRGPVGRRVDRRGRGARTLDRARLLRGPERRRQVPRRLAADGRRRLDRLAGASCGSPTARRT